MPYNATTFSPLQTLMHSNTFLRLVLALTLITAASCPSTRAAEKDSLFSGTWKWTTTTQDGQKRESVLTLKQDGDKWAGVLKGPRGENPVKDAKVLGQDISFTVERETQRGKMIANYKGKLEGETIKGAVHTKTGDQERDREWLATRESLDVTGDWAWSMKRDNGETWNATLHIKKDGDKIVGQFEREGAETKIELQNAKLSGSTLTFETTMQRDGQSTTIKNSAVITGKAMKGKAQGTRDGEAWTREWEAAKK